MKLIFVKFLILFACILFLAPIIYAAQSYRSSHGATITVDEFGVCKKVKNNGGNSYFIPTKTSGEWFAFRSAANNYLTDIFLNNCIISGRWVNDGYYLCRRSSNNCPSGFSLGASCTPVGSTCRICIIKPSIFQMITSVSLGDKYRCQ